MWQQAGVRQRQTGAALRLMATGLLRTTNVMLGVQVLLGVLGAAAVGISNLEEVDVILGSSVDVPLQWVSSVSLYASVEGASFMKLWLGGSGSAGGVGVGAVTNSSACPSPDTALSIIVADEAGAKVGAALNVTHATPHTWDGQPSLLQQTLHTRQIVQATSGVCIWKAGTMVFQLSIHDASVLETGGIAVVREIEAAIAGLPGDTHWGVVMWWLPKKGERVVPCEGGTSGAAAWLRPQSLMSRHGDGGRLLAESDATAIVAAAAAYGVAPMPLPLLSATSSKDAGATAAGGGGAGRAVGAASLRKRRRQVVGSGSAGPNGSNVSMDSPPPSQVSAAQASTAGIPDGDQISVDLDLYGPDSQVITYSLVLDGRRLGLCQGYPTLSKAWAATSYRFSYSCNDGVLYGGLCRMNVFFYNLKNFGGREVDLSQEVFDQDPTYRIRSFRVCTQLPHWNSVRPLGCFSDSIKRTISWLVPMSSSPATFWKCYRIAYAMGMTTFALQGGVECYIGWQNATIEAMLLGFVASNDSQMSPGASPVCSGCNMACQADPTQRCGGYAQNQLYQIMGSGPQRAPLALYLFIGSSVDGYTGFLSCPGTRVTRWIITTGRMQGSSDTIVAGISLRCSDGSVLKDNTYRRFFKNLDAPKTVPVGNTFTAGGSDVLTNFMGVGTPSSNQRNLGCSEWIITNFPGPGQTTVPKVSGIAFTQNSSGIQALTLHCGYPNLLYATAHDYLVLPTSAAFHSIWPLGGNFDFSTMEDCQSLCDWHNECEFVSYDTVTGLCIPQSGLPGLGWEQSIMPDTVTLPLRGNTVVGFKNMSSGSFYYVVGIDWPSWDEKYLVEDVYACQTLCENFVSGCVVFAHQSQIMGAMGECRLVVGQSSPQVVTAVKYRGLAKCDGQRRCPPGLCCSKKNGLCGAGYDYCGAACEGSNNRYCSPGRAEIGEFCGRREYIKPDDTGVMTTQYCGDGLCCGGNVGGYRACGVGAGFCLVDSGCQASYGTCVTSLSSAILVPVAQCSSTNLYVAYCKGTGCTAIPEFVQGEKRDSTWISTMVEVKCCTMFNQCVDAMSASGNNNTCQFGPRSIGGGLWLYIFDTVADYEVVCDPWWGWWWWWGK